MASVKWDADALKELELIDAAIAGRIVEKVSWLEANFSSVVPEKLSWNLRGLYKLRIGDYRVIYTLARTLIIIKAVRHRSEVYR